MLVQSFKNAVVKNAILGSLPPEDFAFIRPYLQYVAIKERTLLQDPKKKVEHVNFIESGVASLRTVAMGGSLEIAMVDCRGMIGVSVPLGGTPVHQSTMVIAGSALNIRADDLRKSMQERPQIREHFFRYVQVLLIHSAQSALCGIRHELEQRLACWLCLACDSIDGTVLPVTHDYLSTMLGLRRAGVTEALLKFECEGLIAKSRGMLQVKDFSSLSKRACGCYVTIANAYRGVEIQADRVVNCLTH